jgi:hypothetical protein
VGLSTYTYSQTDTAGKLVPLDTIVKNADTVIRNEKKVDSVLKKHSPRKAAIRSAIVPGWGQAYNKKYWKIPLVYGALGTTGYVFFYNLTTYRDLRLAYKGKYFASLPVNNGRDSTFYNMMDPRYRVYEASALRYERDEFRRNLDYSVLFFLVFWGLNVVDATVDAHLKSFDVSPDLSFRIKAGYSEIAKTNGLSLVLAFK